MTLSRSSRLKQDVEEVGAGESDCCDESPRGEAVSCHGDAVLLGRSQSNCENDSECRPKALESEHWGPPISPTPAQTFPAPPVAQSQHKPLSIVSLGFAPRLVSSPLKPSDAGTNQERKLAQVQEGKMRLKKQTAAGKENAQKSGFRHSTLRGRPGSDTTQSGTNECRTKC
jgi:hypothetical protein